MSDDTSATGWHRHDGFNRVHPASDCSVTTPDRIPVLVVDPAEAREKIDALVADAGHWATMENGGPGDLVCECGLPWTIGKGCVYVQGAHDLLAALAGGDT